MRQGWEYSKEKCDKNAEIEGVAARVTFQKASASSLPYPDEYFDAVVSNLTFHEVKDSSDRREVIKEALRILKKNGKFAFQDLFLIKSVYSDREDLIKTMKSWRLTSVDLVMTRDAPFVQRPLKLPFMLGTMRIIKGEK